MRVQIVTRNCDVSAPVLARTEEQIERLKKFDPRLASAEVVFLEERHLKRVEAVLSLDGDEPAVAHGEGNEFRPALDQLVERLSKILRRRRDRMRDHQGPKLSEVVDGGV